MWLRSSAFADGSAIPRRFTCEGEDLSPPLSWGDVPAGTKSFAVLCDDPDAPSGTWHHWAAYDIARDRTSLPEGVKPGERSLHQAGNDSGVTGYSGPCPPRGHGRHRYRFHLLALSRDSLGTTKGDCRAIEREARRHVLAEAVLTGVYERR
jgi:Raf kinase inhibitor-like YbhB/YbcL family protein